MNQLDFNKLLEKYLEGSCSPDEEAVVTEWYAKQDQKILPELNEAEKQVLEKRIWTNIKAKTFSEKRSLLSIPPQYRRIFWYGLAASILFLAVVFVRQQMTLDRPNETAQIGARPDVEIKNTSEKNQEIRLEDSSLVILEP